MSGGQKTRKPSRLVLEGTKCRGCRGPVVVEGCDLLHQRLAKENPGQFRLCHYCISRVLVKATIAVHGDISDSPGSNGRHGHENRMADHERRVRAYYLAHPDVPDAREYLITLSGETKTKSASWRRPS